MTQVIIPKVIGKLDQQESLVGSDAKNALPISKTVGGMLPINENITNENLKQDLLNILSDEHSRKILDAIIDVPKSILEISNDTKVPMRTVYRKVQSFHDSQLLKISGNITDSGKKYFLYKSKIRSISAAYHQNNLVVNVIKNNTSN